VRILHIGNGRAFKIKAIADAFVERGHDVHMVSVPPMDGDWPGVTWHRLPDTIVPGKAKVLARVLQMRKLVRQLRPDVVHAHNAWGPGWYGASVGVHPFVIHAYGGDLLPEQYAGRPAVERAVTGWSCRSADRIVVTGRHMIDAAGLLGVPPERLMLLPRGVDLERYRPGLDTTALRQRLAIGDGAPVVFSPRYQVNEALYNLDTVIEAFVAIRKRFPAAVCVQLFEPERESGRARLEALAAERGIADAYRLVPAVDNTTMPLFYNLADVVVSVPSSDGFPVTILEASACGAALVVSELPYCAEWFQGGDNGVVVPVRDARRLADAVNTLLADRDRRGLMGAAARRLVAARADYRGCMNELETVYRTLVADVARRRKDS
jgi:glycosyltransferase involved in cell wall biosynthesis